MVALDLENPVIRILSSAAPLEATQPHMVRQLYLRAWDTATDDYEACMAAHYVARIQDDAEARFRWNAIALERARRDVRAIPFLPSLHLNMGRSFEDLGRVVEARASYRSAMEALADIPADPYRATLDEAIARALRRVAGASDSATP
jgi:hypothetical protein